MIRSAALALALAATPAAAFDIDAMSPGEREAFGAEVRSYLLENPEVLMEAMAVLEAREAEMQAEADAAAIAAEAEALFADEDSWVGGNPEGDVTIVEFLDYRCGFCRRAHPVIGELLSSDGEIRLIVKELPILGPESVLASRFALAVKAQHGEAAYEAMHDELMTFNGPFDIATLAGLAEDAGFEAEPLLAALDDAEITRVIDENRALAGALGISGTPSFVVGDMLLRGFLPLEGMEAVVAEARAD